MWISPPRIAWSGIFAEHSAEVIFNCAAYTNVDGCEERPDLAMAVNGDGAGRLAGFAAARGAHLLHVSTDFVFDGRKAAPYVEEDAPAPLSEYGRTKLEGERLVMAAGGRYTIARTAWLYGRAGGNFVDAILKAAAAGKALKGVTDQVGSPTWTRDLADALIALAAQGKTGLYHTVNNGQCSRYDQIAALVEYAGLSVAVEPVGSDAFPRPACVPAFSPLSVAKLARDTGVRMRSWDEALKEYVRTQSCLAGQDG